jgi:predicted amidohydrolase YtcJ
MKSVWAGLGACWLASSGAWSADAQRADLVLIHGHILTMDAKDRAVQAIAIRGNTIIAVGTDRQILKMAAPAARVIDLHGRTATPGLIDTHAHLAEGGLDALFAVDLVTAHSIAEMVGSVSERAAKTPPGDWIYGAGWDEGKLADGRLPSAADLDKAAPNNPVWLLHTTGHYGVANTLALKLAGISADLPDPPASTIDRDATRNPTGVLREDTAMQLVEKLLPSATLEQREAAILHEIDILHSEGMTAIKDPAIQREDWDAYRALLDAGKLKERICVLWAAGATMASAEKALAELKGLPHAPDSLGNGRLISCGAKIFMDGSGGARTAWNYEDWNRNWTGHDDGNRGYPAVDPDIYRQMVTLFHAGRYQIGTHAIGDRAVDFVADTYAEALRHDPVTGLRHTIIHANLTTDHALETIALLEHRYDAGYPELQAPFLWWIGDTYAGNYGAERSARLVPLKTMTDHHIIWGGGSDFPVTPLPARYGLWASTARIPLKGLYGTTVFGTAQSVSIHEALRSYTNWAAPLLFLQDKAGSIEPGKRADIAIWDRDPYAVATAEVKDMKCEMTLLDGEIVYRSDDAAATIGGMKRVR